MTRESRATLWIVAFFLVWFPSDFAGYRPAQRCNYRLVASCEP